MTVTDGPRVRGTLSRLIVIGMTLALCGLFAGSAAAKVVYDSFVHRSFGIAPSLSSAGGLGATSAAGQAPLALRPSADAGALGVRSAGAPGAGCGTCQSPLIYNGGPVQHGENDYLFFWIPSAYAAPSGYIAGMEQWLGDLAGADVNPANPISVATQYYDNSGPAGARSFVPYDIADEPVIIDTNPYPSPSNCTDSDPGGLGTMPACLTDADIQAELTSWITNNNLPVNLNTEYFVLTPPNVGSCFDSTSIDCSFSSYCGYHDSITINGQLTTYADLPYLYGSSGCDIDVSTGSSAYPQNFGYPNPGFIDSEVSVFSHELSETMTDPDPNGSSFGWMDSGGNEIGDKCAYIYGGADSGTYTGLNSDATGYWNVQLGSDVYLLQQEFDNRILDCASRLTETWTGAAPGGAGASSWSKGANWAAAIAPGAGASSGANVDTLSFPALTSASCMASAPPPDTCYSARNNLTTLSPLAITIDDGSGYSLSGNTLDLGGGGLSATTKSGTPGPASLTMPIALSASQTWSIDGGQSSIGAVVVGGPVTGAGDALSLKLRRAATLGLGGDDEVGAVSISGASSSDTGPNAALNGTVTLARSLNGTDGRPVTLTDSELVTQGATGIGSFTSTGSDVEVGQGASPAGSLAVAGGLSLDSASRLRLFIADSAASPVAGTDNSELTATGSVRVGGTLTLVGAGGTCPTLSAGAVYTLVKAGINSHLTGTFVGLPSGSVIPFTCSGSTLPLVLDYTGSALTATAEPLPATNSAAPAVSGTPQQGRTLVVSSGTWTPASTLSEQWEDCNGSGTGCAAIAGATGHSYTLQAGDVGHTVVVAETADDGNPSKPVADSQPTAVVTAAPAPLSTSRPAISGTPQEGRTLTESHGGWSGLFTGMYSYQWEDCTGAGTGCTAIAGASAQTYTLRAADLGHAIAVVETASNGANRASARSSPTSPVTAATPPPTPRRPPEAAVASAGRAHVSGASVSVPLTCSGPAGSSCSVSVRLTATETLAGRRVIAIAAVDGKANAKRTLILAHISVVLSGGERRTVLITLSGAGARLLTSRRSLPATLTVLSANRPIAVVRLAFRTGSGRKRRHERRRPAASR